MFTHSFWTGRVWRTTISAHSPSARSFSSPSSLSISSLIIIVIFESVLSAQIRRACGLSLALTLSLPLHPPTLSRHGHPRRRTAVMVRPTDLHRVYIQTLLARRAMPAEVALEMYKRAVSACMREFDGGGRCGMAAEAG